MTGQVGRQQLMMLLAARVVIRGHAGPVAVARRGDLRDWGEVQRTEEDPLPSEVRQVALLLLPQDERAVADAIMERYPAVKFLDSRPWEAESVPPIVGSINSSGSSLAIWNPEIHPVLPVDTRPNGIIMGPQIGPVVQWLRSCEIPSGSLNSGRWAATIGNGQSPEMSEFIKGIWDILMKLTRNELERLKKGSSNEDSVVSESRFRIGPMALERAMRGELKLVSGGMILRPRP
ncbi:hypothetical protein [Streptacidiphilus sp. EB129]|uniref:hypothetical protein n=1 Tax=Streptacidiphilus sp. EB129 TaxID=3156262 RepID=UPI003516B6E8